VLLAERLERRPLADVTTRAPVFVAAAPPRVSAPPPEALRPVGEATAHVDAAVTTVLPPDIAVLWVLCDGEDRFSLYGSHSEVELPYAHTQHMQRPGQLNLSSLARDEGGKAAPDVYYLMLKWSQSKPELSKWLGQLQEAQGDSLNLVIADLTGYDIPWELFFVAQPDGSNRILGATVPVTRLHIRTEGGDLWPGPAICEGGSIAYIDPGLTSAEAERATLAGAEPLPTLADLRWALRDGRPVPCALVYVACEGSFDKELTKLALGREGDRLSFRDLDMDGQLRLLLTAPCIVFLNACESVRPALDPYLNDASPNGFPQLLMARGAGGVIGTVGLVDSTVAAEVGRRLIDSARSPEGLVPADALRRMRAEAAEEIHSLADVTPRFIWPYMYLWFGNPHTRLRLIQGGED
jgi:CHAT domain